ncbi:MAG: hypothetical protein AAF480_10225 [Actinomycetota bacterium]
MTAVLRQQGAKIGQMVDRSRLARHAVARGAARFYRAKGASKVIIDDALAQVDEFPVASTRSTMRWAAALIGKSSFPVRYRPDKRLRSPEAIAEARRLIDGLIDGGTLSKVDDAEVRRYRAYLQRDRAPDDPALVEFVTTQLDKRLRAFATQGDKTKVLKPAEGFAVLSELHQLLSAEGMRPFLVSGTLLGVVRDGGLLAHDYDLDIGLLPGDGTAEQVADVLNASGSCGPLNVEKYRVWGDHRSGVSFDVFLHYEERGRYYHATLTHAWWNSPFGLEPVTIHDETFWIPDDTETYLRENYGDWRAPIAFYHKSFDTPNREYCNSTEALLYLYDLIVGATNNRGNRFAAESATRELARNFGIDLRHHFGSSRLLDDDADISRILDE